MTLNKETLWFLSLKLIGRKSAASNGTVTATNLHQEETTTCFAFGILTTDQGTPTSATQVTNTLLQSTCLTIIKQPWKQLLGAHGRKTYWLQAEGHETRALSSGTVRLVILSTRSTLTHKCAHFNGTLTTRRFLALMVSSTTNCACGSIQLWRK